MSLAPVLSAPIFQWFVPAQNGTGLVPAVGYVVQFYAANTATPKTVYTDPALTIPYPSPFNKVTLNSQGYATIYLGSGGYKITVSTPSGSVIFVQDNIVSNGAFGTGFVNTVADLADINTNLNTFTFVGGYYAIDDGGGSMFYNKVSIESANAGYIFDSSFDPSKKWFRIAQGDVYAAYFGYIPGLAGDQTSQLEAADAYAATLYSARLVIQSGNLATVTAINFSSPAVVMQPGAQFNGASAVTLTFRGLMEAYGAYTNTSVGPGIFSIFGTNITAILSASTIAIPEWFGATTASSDNKPAFDKLWASGAGGYRINPGIWVVSTTTPPNFVRILSFGKVWNGTTTFIPIGEYYFTAQNIVSLGDITATGNLSSDELSIIDGGTFGGDVNANNLNANLNVGAGQDITAGTAGPHGALSALAGTGGVRFKAAGRLFCGVGAPSYTLKGNTLLNNGDSLRVCVTHLSSASSGSITFLVGSFVGPPSNAYVVQFAVTGLDAIDYFVCDIVRVSNTSLFYSAYVVTNGSQQQPKYNTCGFGNFSLDQIISFTGVVANELLIVDFFPA